MLKKCFLCLASFSYMSLFSVTYLPKIIEAEQFNTTIKNYYDSIDPRAWTLGRWAFYQAPELIPCFALLKQDYGIDVVVETGTWKGESTTLFALLFNEVHTIEILDSHYQIATNNLKQFSNVKCHFGSSAGTMSTLLPSLAKKRVLFFLDAHWNTYWPLLDELEEISKTHKDNCIVVIDDIKVPNRPDIPYDKYGDDECSFEYVESKLNKIFSDYTVHYLIPEHLCSRAKFIAIPKNWQEKR